MKAKINDPNQEVEGWKDKVYKQLNNFLFSQLGLALEKKANEIIEKNHIKISSCRPINKPQLATL